MKKISCILLAGLTLSTLSAYANQVTLKADKPSEIVYQVAHKNQNSGVVLGEARSVRVDKEIVIPVDLNNFDFAGLIIVSANGHQLPTSINQFDQPRQCSMTTDKNKSSGELVFDVTEHSIVCRTFGGVFG